MAIEINRVLVGALQQCDTKELVEDTFIRFSISDNFQKTNHLIEAMGNPTLFFQKAVWTQTAILPFFQCF